MINLAATFGFLGHLLMLERQLAGVRKALDYDLKREGISPVIADPAARVLYRSNMRAFKVAAGMVAP